MSLNTDESLFLDCFPINQLFVPGCELGQSGAPTAYLRRNNVRHFPLSELYSTDTAFLVMVLAVGQVPRTGFRTFPIRGQRN
jgi:hypothetical protein